MTTSPALRPSSLVLAAALAATTAACAGQKPEPAIASSAPEAGYARGYPAALTASATSFSKDQGEVHADVQAFAGYPGELKEPRWDYVREIYKAADGAGRSYAYVEQNRRVEGAAAFFADEKDEITKKVAGSAQYVVKKQGCEGADVTGAVAQSLKDSVDKQLEKDLRKANEGQLLVDRYRAQLGKENAAALEKQADAISRASFLAHVALVETKLRVQRMVDEAEEVRKTYDETLRQERAFQADRKTTDAEKKASEERIAEVNKSRAELDASIAQGKGLLPEIDDKLRAVQKEHDEAMAALLAKVDANAKASGK